MHLLFSLDEILRLVTCELVASEARATAVALARCCGTVEIWKEGGNFVSLLGA